MQPKAKFLKLVGLARKPGDTMARPARFRPRMLIGVRRPARPRCVGDAGGSPGRHTFARKFHLANRRESTGFGKTYLEDREIIERLLFLNGNYNFHALQASPDRERMTRS